MGDSLDDELTALRARAYGADADIHDDPGAISRLRRLEDEVRARETTVQTPPVPPLPSSDPTHLSAAPASAAGPAEVSSPESARVASPAEEPGAERRRPAVRRLLGACALTAIATAALTVPITLWVEALPEQPYAVLQPIDAPPNTVFFSPESEAQRYEDFYGIRVSTGALDYQQGRCILIELQPDVDSEFESGETRGACSAPGFEAIADVSAIGTSLPEAAREALGDITALRFAVVGDEVHVFVADEPVPTPES